MSETKLAKVNYENGLVKLDNLESAYRFAKYVIASGLAPKSMTKPESVLVAFQHGAELGLKPMQSLKSIAVINGVPSVFGKAATGLVMQSGKCILHEEWYEGEGENLIAFCKVKRKGLESIKVGQFSMKDAKRAGLLDKSGELYKKYPQDMIMYKARARAYAIFGDVLCGLPIYEDYLDVPVERKSITEEPESSEDTLFDEILEQPEDEPDEPTPFDEVEDEIENQDQAEGQIDSFNRLQISFIEWDSAHGDKFKGKELEDYKRFKLSEEKTEKKFVHWINRLKSFET